MNTQASEKSPWWMRLVFGRNPRVTLIRLAVTTVGLIVLFKYLLIPIKVSGMSMGPTYINGQVHFVHRLAYASKQPKRGDVVAIKIRLRGEELLLKRIVGLPGEEVRLRNGKVYINGTELDEPYVRRRGAVSRPKFTVEEFTVEEDHYFVIGDNREDTYFKVLPGWNILGKVVF